MAGTGECVGAVVSMRTVSGGSVFDPKGPITAARASAFSSSLGEARQVADILIRQGFEITNFHTSAMSFSGTPERFQSVFGIRLEKRAKPGGRGRSTETFVPARDEAPKLLDLPAAFRPHAEGVAIACPPKLVDDASLPVRDISDRQSSQHCLADELAMAIWGDGSASPTSSGDGVVMAQISTGHYRHRFFAERRYRVLPTLLGPNQKHALRDDHGHGTGEAACLFASAPNLRLRPVKGLLDPVGDILMTIESRPRPDLIVNSWGYDVDQSGWDRLKADDPNLHNYLRLLELAIAQAVAKGIVVAAASPRTWRSFPAAHPDVLAIGSASRDGHSAVESGLFPGRNLPDFLSNAAQAGQAPNDKRPSLFKQPAQPCAGPSPDSAASLPANVDEWAWYDLDQASFPLAAGLVALLIERHQGLPPSAVKTLLARAAEEASPIRTAEQDDAGPDDFSVKIGLGRNTVSPLLRDRMTALATAVEQGAA